MAFSLSCSEIGMGEKETFFDASFSSSCYERNVTPKDHKQRKFLHIFQSNGFAEERH